MQQIQKDHVVNPETQRQIRIGGQAWLRLVRAGVLNQDTYLTKHCVYKASSNLSKAEAIKALKKEKKRMIDNNEVDYKHVAVIRGDSITLRQRKSSVADSAILTSNAALNIIDDIKDNRIKIDKNMSREDARCYLQGLIFDEMLKNKSDMKLPTKRLKPQKNKKKFFANYMKRQKKSSGEKIYIDDETDYAGETETETEIETETETEYETETETEYET